MKYMLTMTESESGFASRNDPAYWGAWMSYTQEIKDAGIFVFGSSLEPPHTATTIRIRDGKHNVQDGPFADTKEQLGGFFIVDVENLDEALKWAAKSPSALTASVEVRPALVPRHSL